jgi:hypothetical protein
MSSITQVVDGILMRQVRAIRGLLLDSLLEEMMFRLTPCKVFGDSKPEEHSETTHAYYGKNLSLYSEQTWQQGKHEDM